MFRVFTSQPKPAAQPVNKRSALYLRRLASQLRKFAANSTSSNLVTVADVKLSAAAIASIQDLADILVFSDNSGNNDLFDIFIEEKLNLTLLRLFYSDDDILTLSLFRFFNVLFEGLQKPSNLYFLLSNNFMNDIISVKFNTNNEEILSYYVTLLKNLSLKLNSKTTVLLFNDSLTDFPLFSEAIKYFRHSERMIRIAVQTVTLNIFKESDQLSIDYILNTKRFLATIARTIERECTSFCNSMASSELASSDAVDIVDDIVDLFLYVQEILELNIPQINANLTREMAELFILPLFVDKLSSTEFPRIYILLLLTQFLAHTRNSDIRSAIISHLFFDVHTDSLLNSKRRSLKFIIKRSGLLSRSENISSNKDTPRNFFVTSLQKTESDVYPLMCLCNLYLILHGESADMFLAATGDRWEPTSPVTFNDKLVEGILLLISGNNRNRYRMLTLHLALFVLMQLLSVGSDVALKAALSTISEMKDVWRDEIVHLLEFVEIRDAASLLLYELTQDQLNLAIMAKSTRIIFPYVRRLSNKHPTYNHQVIKNIRALDRSLCNWVLLSRYFAKFQTSDGERVSIRPDFLENSEMILGMEKFSTLDHMKRDMSYITRISTDDEIFSGLKDDEKSDESSDQGFLQSSPPDYIDLSARSLIPCTIYLAVPGGFESIGVKGYFICDDFDMILVEPNRLRLGKGTKIKVCHLLDTRVYGQEDVNSLLVEEKRLVCIEQRNPDLPVQLSENSPTIEFGGGYDVASYVSRWKARLEFPSSHDKQRVWSYIDARKDDLQRRHKLRFLKILHDRGNAPDRPLEELPLIVGRWENESFAV